MTGAPLVFGVINAGNAERYVDQALSGLSGRRSVAPGAEQCLVIDPALPCRRALVPA
jgi:hypothetical protein